MNWTSPGRLDSKLVDEKLKERAETIKKAETEYERHEEAKNEPAEHDMNPGSASAVSLFDEYTDDLERNSLKNLRLTHKKAAEDSNTKRVACMDKILHDLRKNYDIKPTAELEDEPMVSIQDSGEATCEKPEAEMHQVNDVKQQSDEARIHLEFDQNLQDIKDTVENILNLVENVI